MTAALYNGDGVRETQAVLVNSSRAVHCTCLLREASQARVRDRLFCPRVGEGCISFAPGERFAVRYGAHYQQVGLALAPALFSELVDDDYQQVIEAVEQGFLMRASRPGDRTIAAATRLAQRIQQPDSLLLHAAALEYLGWLLHGLTPDERNPRTPLRERRCLLAARDRLLSNLSEPPTIAELAQDTGLNQLKLKQGFKALFGTSIYALFQQHRMDRARQLLRQHSVTETALMLGYSNISHFSAAFRKQFGVLPSETRRHYLGSATANAPV
ncbi:AraC family transcriptional regulator [Marichromatium purpuratum 984]|uniref:AraC family transcriptional regulator n=2 Tax=Marichromatium purpuratum TaxID=37487 RepID=W0E4C9_MARPU|nr:AraC family transcriptional regulator [Marichromatium purpuratum 984]